MNLLSFFMKVDYLNVYYIMSKFERIWTSVAFSRHQILKHDVPNLLPDLPKWVASNTQMNFLSFFTIVCFFRCLLQGIQIWELLDKHSLLRLSKPELCSKKAFVAVSQFESCLIWFPIAQMKLCSSWMLLCHMCWTTYPNLVAFGLM